MRKTSTIFSLLIAIAIISASMQTAAQGRSQDNNQKRDHKDNHDANSRDRYSYYEQARRDHGDRNNHRDKHHQKKEVRHVHHHDRYCDHRPVVVHHHKKPRYIYYRDYDVYYDCQKSVYIAYSGRSWSVTTAVPTGMRHMNVRSVKSYEVDYYDDDFPRYLERRRPSYGQVYTGW